MASQFSPLTSTGPAPTAKEVFLSYRRSFLQQLSDGVRRPQVFPYHYFSIFLGIAYLCIPHKQNPVIYAARWPLVGLITWFEFCAILETSGTGPSMGFSIGQQSVLIIMSSWTWLIFRRPQWDAKRVERRRVRVIKDEKRALLIEESNMNGELGSEKSASDAILLSREGCYEEINEYFWQSYPENLKERISWVADLLLNCRGPGWDWSVPIVRTLTPDTLSKLDSSSLEGSYSCGSLTSEKSFKSRFCRIFWDFLPFISGYLLLDVTWTLMMQDPYFKFGPNTYDLPSYLQNVHPQILYIYHLTLTGTILMTSMRTFTAVINTFMIYVLGTRVLGLRGEPWYYNQFWGSFSKVFERGLGGLWGNFWHQTFRHFFTSPMKYLIQEGYVKPGSFTAKLIGLSLAFTLSGFLHWAAMFTAIGDTLPLYELIFFILQGVGIVLQDSVCKLFSPIIIKLPSSIRQMGNLFYTLAWFYLTGWIEADNMARSGINLVPLVPFSPMTALGFGEHDANWKSWESVTSMWFSGKNWWESGYFAC